MSTPTHRQAIISTAAKLFRKQGYVATGINQILEQSGAPKGSLYHYFKGGKAEIGATAIELAGKRVERTLSDLATQAGSPGKLMLAYSRMLAEWMERSRFRDGCPIATTVLEAAPQEGEITRAGSTAYKAWTQIVQTELERAGAPAERACALASFAIAALLGALIQARVSQDARPILIAGEELASLLDTRR